MVMLSCSVVIPGLIWSYRIRILLGWGCFPIVVVCLGGRRGGVRGGGGCRIMVFGIGMMICRLLVGLCC